MIIKVQNDYSDGHSSQFEMEVDDRSVDYALLDGIDGLVDLLWEFTGDGHGASHDVESVYEVTVLESPREELVGFNWEWA